MKVLFCLISLMFFNGCFFFAIVDRDQGPVVVYTHSIEKGKLTIYASRNGGAYLLAILRMHVLSPKKIVWDLEWGPPVKTSEIVYGDPMGAKYIDVPPERLKDGVRYEFKIERIENLTPDCYVVVFKQNVANEQGERCSGDF
ncbi:hypothetical protein CH379_019835 [Leptospira ellisii]|nr:hypothetical protein [Leptospira ellisii]MDV6237883.1 hypothetical protein [Leptospira ellisii]